MSISWDTGDTGDLEIKRLHGVSSLAHERNEETAKTGIHMNGNVVLPAKLQITDTDNRHW